MDASEDRKRQEEMEIFWGVRLGECIRGRAPYNPDDASLVFSPPWISSLIRVEESFSCYYECLSLRFVARDFHKRKTDFTDVGSFFSTLDRFISIVR